MCGKRALLAELPANPRFNHFCFFVFHHIFSIFVCKHTQITDCQYSNSKTDSQMTELTHTAAGLERTKRNYQKRQKLARRQPQCTSTSGHDQHMHVLTIKCRFFEEGGIKNASHITDCVLMKEALKEAFFERKLFSKQAFECLKKVKRLNTCFEILLPVQRVCSPPAITSVSAVLVLCCLLAWSCQGAQKWWWMDWWGVCGVTKSISRCD